MALPSFVAEAWVNLPYARATNQQHPAINPASPGAPYFVDAATAVPGQWVRLVLRLAKHAPTFDDDVVCVGTVAGVEPDERVRVTAIRHESGRAPPALKHPWLGTLQRGPDATWVLDDLRPDPDDQQARLVAALGAATTGKAVETAVTRLERAGFALPDDDATCMALLVHPDEARVRWALGVLRGRMVRRRPEHPALLSSRLRRLVVDAEDPATQALAAEVRDLMPR